MAIAVAVPPKGCYITYMPTMENVYYLTNTDLPILIICLEGNRGLARRNKSRPKLRDIFAGNRTHKFSAICSASVQNSGTCPRFSGAQDIWLKKRDYPAISGTVGRYVNRYSCTISF